MTFITIQINYLACNYSLTYVLQNQENNPINNNYRKSFIPKKARYNQGRNRKGFPCHNSQEI